MNNPISTIPTTTSCPAQATDSPLYLLRLFRDLQSRIFHNLVKTWRQHSLLKIIVITIFALLFLISIFVFFYRGFIFFDRYIPRDFFNMIVDYLFSVFYFVLLVMLAFSSTVIAFSVFFHAQETQYLMTCPLPFASIFFYKFFETFLIASWSVFFLGVPICSAYAIQQHVSWDFCPLLILIFIPFVTIAALLGCLGTFLMVLYLRKFMRWIGVAFVIGMVVGVVMLIGAIATLRYENPAFSASWLFSLFEYFSFAKHPLAPSTWASKAMLYLSRQEYGDFLFYLTALYSTMLFLGMLSYAFVYRGYADAWNTVHSNKVQQNLWPLRWLKKTIRPIFFLHPQDKIFLEKDIKIFIRDPLQWSQFAILLGLLLLYILNLRTFQYDQRILFWRHFITTLNLGATGMILCTFASRFIFPMLSLEGKRFWMLGIMPISKRGVLLTKFLFSVVTLTLTSEILIFLSCYMLRLPWGLILLNCFSVLEITLGVSGLAVGIGAIYPNFKEDSPAKIVSGFGGTLNLVISLFFVLGMVSLQNIPAYLILRETISPLTLYLWTIAGLMITTVACIVPLHLGIKSFEALEM